MLNVTNEGCPSAGDLYEVERIECGNRFYPIFPEMVEQGSTVTVCRADTKLAVIRNALNAARTDL